MAPRAVWSLGARARAMVFNHRGLSHAREHQYDRAIQDYDEVIRLDPNFTLAFQDRRRAHARAPFRMMTAPFGSVSRTA